MRRASKSDSAESPKIKSSAVPQIKEAEFPPIDLSDGKKKAQAKVAKKPVAVKAKTTTVKASAPQVQVEEKPLPKGATANNTSKEGAKVFRLFGRKKNKLVDPAEKKAEELLGAKPAIIYSAGVEDIKHPKRAKQEAKPEPKREVRQAVPQKAVEQSEPRVSHAQQATPSEPLKVVPKSRKKLFRSRRYRIIAGVAGGMGERLGVEPTIIRLLWVLSSLAGIGIIGYLAAWAIIPERPLPPGRVLKKQASPGEANLIIGLLLVAMGAWFLFNNLDLIPVKFFEFVNLARLAFWPIALILFGTVTIIVTSRGRISLPTRAKPLHRSITNRKVFGVAGGMAEYLAVEATLIRLTWIALCVISAPVGLGAYIVLSFVIPEEPEESIADGPIRARVGAR